jgi:hypothetical protein
LKSNSERHGETTEVAALPLRGCRTATFDTLPVAKEKLMQAA